MKRYFQILHNKYKSIILKTGTESKVKLNISLFMESILDLNEVKSLMKIQIQLKVAWTDSRLEFRNVEQRLNTISLAQKRKLWLPSLIFKNTNNKTEASFVDDSSNGNIEINPESKGKIADLMEIHNFKEFTGLDG